VTDRAPDIRTVDNHNPKDDKVMYTKAALPPVVQTSHLSGFKFSTIGQGPSLLERMTDSPLVPIRTPQPDQNSSQDQHNASHTRLQLKQLQPLVIGTSSVELRRSVDPIPTQPAKSHVPTSTSLSPSDPPNDVKPPQPVDQNRASVFSDLQYPDPTPDIQSPVSWESRIALPQSTPMDQDAPVSQLLESRNLPSVPVTNGSSVGTGVVDGATDSSAPSTSSQHGDATTPIEPEQTLRPIEHLFRLASVREERMSKQRDIFDLRSSELSTFGGEAMRAVQDLQVQFESLKQLGEEMRAQAEQTLQEATKMRDMADRLISSAGTLGVDMLGAKNHVDRSVERSEQIKRFVRKSFDWLAALRGREQEKIALIQAEIAEQALAEVMRRQQEAQQQLERQKIEEQKKEAAKREEEEREALRKKAEEEETKRLYEMRRAEAQANKWRAIQAQAPSIQASHERRTADAPCSSSVPSTRSSHPVLSTSPVPNSELVHGAGAPTTDTSSQVAIPAPSRSPVARTGGVPGVAPPSHPLPPSNKIKAVPAFVPAQTEAGRLVNTDLPLSSTTLASELHMRKVVEAPQLSRFNQATRDLAQEQGQPQISRPAAPTLVSHQDKVKREPSPEVLPTARIQPTTDQSHYHQRPATFSTASHGVDMNRHAPIPSNFESHETSLPAAQVEDHRRRHDPLGAVSPHDNRSRDSVYDHVVPSTDERAYKRQDSPPPRWNHRDRRSSSPPSSRERRSRSPSRSPPYPRKRTRSRTPRRYEGRQVDRWPPERAYVRPRVEDDRDRSWRYNDSYDRGRRGGYRPQPPRRNGYRPSPPPSPRLSPRRSNRDRSPAIQHVAQRFANEKWRPDEYRPNANVPHYVPTDEGVDSHRIMESEEQPKWQQVQRRRSPSPSEHDRSPTSSPRQEDIEIGLLDRINMEEANNRARGRGRPPGITRGGPNPWRGMRGGSSSGRGRGVVSEPAPVLLSRMSETARLPARPAPAPSLSDRMQQD
jgi:hypothetical protein